MASFKLTELAVADLTDIRTYIEERENRATANRVLKSLWDAMATLADMPGMGHTRLDLTPQPVRFWPVFSYLIVYQPSEQGVLIVRVLGVRMDVAQLL